MSKSRLEAFSDGLFSIIITIMVLELKTPNTGSWKALANPDFINIFWSYAVSFALVGSFWISHHQIINNVKTVNRKLLWTNLFVIFPISLVPFVTAWHGKFDDSQATSVAYGIVYLWTLISLAWLTKVISADVKENKWLKEFSKARNGMIIVAAIGVILSFWIPQVSNFTVPFILIVWNSGLLKFLGIKKIKEQIEEEKK
jgi:uncharacterized membrane protein